MRAVGWLVLQIMWAEAMGKLEGMESADRERLWPQLVQGFKDLSDRLKVRMCLTGVLLVYFVFNEDRITSAAGYA